MGRNGIRVRWGAATALLCMVAASVAVAGVGEADDHSAGAAPATPPPPARRPPSPRQRLLADFDPRNHEAVEHASLGPRRASVLANGTAVLTLDPTLQEHIQSVFARYEVPYGAVVAIEPSTGRVLAYVSHSSANPNAPDLALDATPPTASVFKVITGAALIDQGVSASERVCYTGGGSRLLLRHLEDRSDDRRCVTLSDAMGGSVNAVFAKLADRHLDRPTLTRFASAFGFGHSLPFDVQTHPSPIDVPTERLEFARTAAGFWHMHMSPLHGALIAATIANDGAMPRAAIVERFEKPDGEEAFHHEPSVFRNVVSRGTARRVNSMMRRTVSSGTSRRAFHDPQGRPFLPNVTVAGKTGTLSAERPYRGYTWWVGFAPADEPTIALAALAINDPRWRIKASHLAVETLRHHFR